MKVSRNAGERVRIGSRRLNCDTERYYIQKGCRSGELLNPVATCGTGGRDVGRQEHAAARAPLVGDKVAVAEPCRIYFLGTW